MYMLDTNTLIYYFKGLGNVARNVLHTSPKEIGVPSIVVYELEVGIEKSSSARKQMAQLHELLDVVTVFPFRRDEAHAAAMIRAQLEKRGTPIGPIDTLIAGTTLAQRAILVTHNRMEFSRVKGLRVEDWF